MTCNCSSNPCKCAQEAAQNSAKSLPITTGNALIQPYAQKEVVETSDDFRAKTIICDIDGTLVKHEGGVCKAAMQDDGYEQDLLPGTLEKFADWDLKGYKVILITGRKESMRKNTESFLASLGIFYDQLVMGVGGGPRILINDRKPDGRDTAFAINVDRNKGLENVTI